MERIMCVNSLINSKNRLLSRVSIYNKFAFGERKFNSINYCAAVIRSNSHLNRISYRYKSSTIDGQIHTLKVKPVTNASFPKARTMKINTTRVTKSSLTQTKQALRFASSGNLPQFMSDTTPNTKSNQEPQMIHLNEAPLLFIPQNLKFNLENNPNILEPYVKSFEHFLRTNPQHEETPKIPLNIDAYPELQQLRNPNTERRKDKDSVTRTDFQNQNFKCFINVCISENLADRAYAMLMLIRTTETYRRKKVDTKDVELYSDLMAHYAMMGNWLKVSDIYKILIADKISITPRIFLNILDCLGRMQNTKQNLKQIKKCIKNAKEQNISLNDIMDKSTFIKDQRTYVLDAIRRIQPSFVPVYTPPQLEYSNKLVETLNKNIHSIDKKPNEILQFESECLISKPKRGFNASELDKFAAEQMQNEIDGSISVKNITMIDSSEAKVKHHCETLEKLTNEWRIDIANAIRKKLNILQNKMKDKSTKLMNIYPYMRLLTPEQYTELLLDEMHFLAENGEWYSPTVIAIYSNLGNRVMQKHQIQVKERNGVNQKIRQSHKTYREGLCSGICPDNPRQLWQRIIHHSRENGPCALQKNINWPWGVQCDIGKTLFKIVLENIKIDASLLTSNKNVSNYEPALYSIFRKRGCMSREEIRPHPVFVKLVQGSMRPTMKFKTNEVPMLCPPIPWTSIESGGYIHSQTDLLRLPSQFPYQNELVSELPPEQIYPVLDSLNQLGAIPWKVNTRVLDLAIKVFNNGGDDKLDVPLTPDHMLSDDHLRYRGITRAHIDEVIKKNYNDEKYQQHQNELLSVYTDTLYKLSLANHFRDRAFWLPTNLDFRGRTYPVPPHLTHLSADLTRSMLCFYQQQPLGESGLDWLKLHCINLTGLKKRNSIADRLAYANEIIDDILDSAVNPLDGRQWWINSDDPWQTLAACMEIADAMRSPNPTEYMTGFPIHQDGSCNGLQHYAALGRDVDGAASVNLAPSEVPQDVYSTIANRVEELRKEDAKNGVQEAIDLEGLVKRKIIKQTVMTTVYGVTAYGARLQIRKQLKNIRFSPESLGVASIYLTKKTFHSLSEMFKSAREIQDWLTDCAKYIVQKDASHVEWTSPLGLPIIQPYTRETKKSSNVSIQTFQNNDKAVNRVKEKNAFSPNFIHSLDACHMMLTSLNCEMNGVTFVSVHDCFWTHPSTVPIMNQICREQFILLHSQPILEELSKSFYQKYENENGRQYTEQSTEIKKYRRKETTSQLQKDIFGDVPQKGKFDLNSVLKSIYFFS